MNDDPQSLHPADSTSRAERTVSCSEDRPAGLAGSLPKDLGVMLVSAGVIGVVLPGPGVPALVAGGLVLWPGAFGKAERWFQKRYPEAHRQGLGHIHRFLTDLERRYPGSTRVHSQSDPNGSNTPSE